MRAALAFVLCIGALCARAAPTSFFIEGELRPARLYVGAETILSQRLVRAPGIPYGVLRPPALGEAAEVWSLGPARWFQQQRDGVAWDIHERTYLVIPRRAGRLVVPGTEIEGPLRRYASAREPTVARASGLLRGPHLVLEVRPPPPGAVVPWLPARRLTLEDSWSLEPARLRVGMPVTRTLILRAEGLPAQRLPQLEMAAHPGLRVHHDKPELSTEHQASGTIGRSIQRIVLVPLDEGDVSLPALSVDWWDIEADVPRKALLAARTFRLRAALAPPASVAEPLVTPLIVRGMASLAALVLVALLWWRVRNEPLRGARRRLREACRANDARAARDALLQWRRVISRDAAPSLVRSVGAEWDAGARAQLGALDAALYGRRTWDGSEFWRRVRPWLRKADSRRVAPAPPLPPFFRLQATASADGMIARQ